MTLGDLVIEAKNDGPYPDAAEYARAAATVMAELAKACSAVYMEVETPSGVHRYDWPVDDFGSVISGKLPCVTRGSYPRGKV